MSALSYHMLVPSPQDFLDELICFIYGENPEPEALTVKSMSFDMITLYIFNRPTLIEFKASEIALASIISALQIMNFKRQVEDIFNLISEERILFNFESVKNCSKKILGILNDL